jgi:hypothetical protein
MIMLEQEPIVAPIYRILYLPNASIIADFETRDAAQSYIRFHLTELFWDKEYLFEVIEV